MDRDAKPKDEHHHHLPRFLKSKNTPAWLSAICAALIGGVALWSLASAPSAEALQDHEERLRALEHRSSAQFSRIETQLTMIQQEIERLRDE